MDRIESDHSVSARGVSFMLIPVVLNDGRQDMVKPFVLERLIETREITSFRRASGWAVIGRDPVRQGSRRIYCIPERREAEFVLNG